MLHRVEFDIWQPAMGLSTRFAVDVDAASGDEAAAMGMNEAHRVANGGGFKVLAIYPVAPGTPPRDGVVMATGPVAMMAEPVDDGVPEKAEAPAEAEEDERTMLRHTLDGLGVHYDKRWGVERLREALGAA